MACERRARRAARPPSSCVIAGNRFYCLHVLGLSPDRRRRRAVGPAGRGVCSEVSGAAGVRVRSLLFRTAAQKIHGLLQAISATCLKRAAVRRGATRDQRQWTVLLAFRTCVAAAGAVTDWTLHRCEPVCSSPMTEQ